MKHKILSFLTAFAMVFGIVAAPFVNASAADAQGTKTVTLHKILQPKDVFDTWPQNGTTTGKDSKEYIGDDITKKTIENYGKENAAESTSTIESFFGKGSKEIDGVYFAWQKQIDGEWKYIDSNGNEAKVQDPKADGFDAAVLGGITGKDGQTGYKFDTSKLATGDYRIQEIPSLSTYTGADKATLTGTKAVPVTIHLPLANNGGVVENAHVYPKNTEEKPTTNKDFSDQFTDNQDGRDAGVEESTQVGNPTDKTKDQKSHNVGDKVPYTVKTTIPVNAKYATAYWSDEMTEGLTFDDNLKITLNGITLVPTIDYEVTKGVNGFKASLTETGLKKVNGQATVQTLVLTYSATINSKAVTQIPESNDVTFHYGNNKSEGNTPIPTKPNENGELEVKKTWDDGEWAEGEKATFVLVDAQTGKQVTAEDLVAPEGDQTAFNEYKANFNAKAEIGYNVNGGSHKWQYLNKDKQYKAIEINRTNGENAEYKKGNDGEIIVVNHKDNTQEINPTEPKVKTGEKKFVKRDKNTDKRLAGAQFIVSAQINNETKYLVEKSAEEIAKQEQEIEAKRTALNEAVTAYKNADEDGKAAALANFEKAQKELDAAILANVKYDWTTEKGKAKVFESNKDGQVKVEGLKDGTYKLIETKAPEKYALPANAEWTFKIGEGDTVDDVFEAAQDKVENAPKDATRIDNTLVSIPQTGGIGSIIFVVAGLMIMGLAAYKMKANKEQA
ncbi:isopeptide-forming domain-containing fimbrial protein [Anaerococcus vaginalis]|uniref:isopeptide-forming domain-containing fimbrial protein n=1 Tax=Anaerococcus vaginalis TaxID=33037 RepID=UPI002907F30D|nr:isopeptide-forming domain-containing fimbrial protein [Anaerococcus vaginalis]MDU5560223.1 isopeptide-forming domain-containing fimbrial protein [Anaerococcus vaginalis]